LNPLQEDIPSEDQIPQPYTLSKEQVYQNSEEVKVGPQSDIPNLNFNMDYQDSHHTVAGSYYRENNNFNLHPFALDSSIVQNFQSPPPKTPLRSQTVNNTRTTIITETIESATLKITPSGLKNGSVTFTRCLIHYILKNEGHVLQGFPQNVKEVLGAYLRFIKPKKEVQKTPKQKLITLLFQSTSELDGIPTEQKVGKPLNLDTSNRFRNACYELIHRNIISGHFLQYFKDTSKYAKKNKETDTGNRFYLEH
jgi:hypothetical protein